MSLARARDDPFSAKMDCNDSAKRTTSADTTTASTPSKKTKYSNTKESVFSMRTYKKGHIVSTSTNGNVVCSDVPFWNGVIVMLNPPGSFVVHQHVGIYVLSGRVSVFGYKMNSQKTPVKVFSTEKTGLIEVKTFEKDIGKKKEDLHMDGAFFDIALNKQKVARLLNQFKDFSVAVFVQSLPYPTEMQLLEHYFPDFKAIVKPSDLNCEINLEPIQFLKDEKQLAINIIKKISRSVVLELDAPRILVFGRKNTGKSTLIRYLINKMFSMRYNSAYYLDTDPNQSEFTLPGVVSLSRVDKPIFGPVFYQLKKDISMIFTGDISVSSPDMHSNSVSKLMQLYERKYKYQPLFINTMGWKNGIEFQCLKNILTIVKPTVVVEMMAGDESLIPDLKDYISKDCLISQIQSSKRNPLFTAKEMHDLTILSYLGKDLSLYNGVVPINEMRPYCVSWDKIPVYIFNQKVQPWRMIEAINLSIVALCVIQETVVLKSNMSEFSTTLRDEPDNECIGFGFVRAIDEIKHILYIVTSLNKNLLKRVNAIMKGNIMVPDAVILKQDICGVPLPYTVESKVGKIVENMETSSLSPCISSLSPVLKEESSASKHKTSESDDCGSQKKKLRRK